MDPDRGSQVRRRLAGGGRRIRTLVHPNGVASKAGLTIAAKRFSRRITDRACHRHISTSVPNSTTRSGGMRKNSVGRVAMPRGRDNCLDDRAHSGSHFQPICWKWKKSRADKGYSRLKIAGPPRRLPSARGPDHGFFTSRGGSRVATSGIKPPASLPVGKYNGTAATSRKLVLRPDNGGCFLDGLTARG